MTVMMNDQEEEGITQQVNALNCKQLYRVECLNLYCL